MRQLILGVVLLLLIVYLIFLLVNRPSGFEQNTSLMIEEIIKEDESEQAVKAAYARFNEIWGEVQE